MLLKKGLEALDDTLWGTHFRGGCGLVVGRNNEWMNKNVKEWMDE
jgi:hypothetical protein